MCAHEVKLCPWQSKDGVSNQDLHGRAPFLLPTASPYFITQPPPSVRALAVPLPRFGDPPEAKQLLAELGEGRGGGALAPALPPATGLMGALNAVAVGAIACVGQAATTLADGMDRLLLASPLGESTQAAAALGESTQAARCLLEQNCSKRGKGM